MSFPLAEIRSERTQMANSGLNPSKGKRPSAKAQGVICCFRKLNQFQRTTSWGAVLVGPCGVRPLERTCFHFKQTMTKSPLATGSSLYKFKILALPEGNSCLLAFKNKQDPIIEATHAKIRKSFQKIPSTPYWHAGRTIYTVIVPLMRKGSIIGTHITSWERTPSSTDWPNRILLLTPLKESLDTLPCHQNCRFIDFLSKSMRTQWLYKDSSWKWNPLEQTRVLNVKLAVRMKELNAFWHYGKSF